MKRSPRPIASSSFLPSVRPSRPVRKYQKAALSLGFALFSMLATASPAAHWFPRLRPLFVGLDESRLTAAQRQRLEEAKADFQLARHRQPPRFAHALPKQSGETRVYEGRGYCLSLIRRQTAAVFREGPSIVLNSSITGGAPYSYDEVDVVVD